MQEVLNANARMWPSSVSDDGLTIEIWLDDFAMGRKGYRRKFALTFFEVNFANAFFNVYTSYLPNETPQGQGFYAMMGGGQDKSDDDDDDDAQMDREEEKEEEMNSDDDDNKEVNGNVYDGDEGEEGSVSVVDYSTDTILVVDEDEEDAGANAAMSPEDKLSEELRNVLTLEENVEESQSFWDPYYPDSF